jgi:hypothetical protein
LDWSVEWIDLAQCREKEQVLVYVVMSGKKGKPYSVLAEKY